MVRARIYWHGIPQIFLHQVPHVSALLSPYGPRTLSPKPAGLVMVSLLGVAHGWAHGDYHGMCPRGCPGATTVTQPRAGRRHCWQSVAGGVAESACGAAAVWHGAR